MKRTASKMASAIAIAAVLGVTPAGATDLHPDEEAQLRDAGYVENVWQGFYASIGGGYEIVSFDFDMIDLSGDDFFVNIRGGYDFQRGRLVGGPLIEASWSNNDIGTLGVDSAWTYAVGARAGLVFGNTLAYVIAKYDFREFDGTVGDQEGLNAGVGVEFHLGGRLFGGVEYTHHFGDDAFSGMADTSVDAVKARIIFKGNPLE